MANLRSDNTLLWLVVLLVGTLGFVLAALAGEFLLGTSFDVERVIAGGLFVVTLAVVWRGFELFVVALRARFELKRRMEAFDRKVLDAERRLNQLDR